MLIVNIQMFITHHYSFKNILMLIDTSFMLTDTFKCLRIYHQAHKPNTLSCS